jgi:4-amino-4-deoxy-L-arabinose transferase-like glycosyltransferase
MRVPLRSSGLAFIVTLTAALWFLNLIWLQRDTRPPVWDMALHQTYALNYMPGAYDVPPAARWWERSGNYPPFVHVAIAFCYFLLHPGPHIAILANIPATLLLFGSVYLLGKDLAGETAARWSCLLVMLTPYLIWFSRETILDYWLAAWVAAALVALRKTDGFRSHSRSLLFGLVCGLGLLTKWFFAAFLALPVVWIFLRNKLWQERERAIHLADSLLLAGFLSGIWYFPNLPKLVGYFFDNARIGALEGEPPVISFQSFIYYLRLLEGYQLFGVLFAILAISAIFAWQRRLLRDGMFLFTAIGGGWILMTLLRTKDPRFSLPLLGPLLVVPGAWIQSWRTAWWTRTLQAGLVMVLCVQAYAANFGIRRLPQEVVLARGYSGSVRWNWNLYLQHYFHILGAPQREDWKQQEIVRTLAADARVRDVNPRLAVIPDLPRFNSANLQLFARLRGFAMEITHLQVEPRGLETFHRWNYVLLTEKDQGMPWSTVWSRMLNQIVTSKPEAFHLIGVFPLPEENQARLYYIDGNKNGDADERQTAKVSRGAERHRRQAFLGTEGGGRFPPVRRPANRGGWDSFEIFAQRVSGSRNARGAVAW